MAWYSPKREPRYTKPPPGGGKGSFWDYLRSQARLMAGTPEAREATLYPALGAVLPGGGAAAAAPKAASWLGRAGTWLKTPQAIFAGGHRITPYISPRVAGILGAAGGGLTYMGMGMGGGKAPPEGEGGKAPPDENAILQAMIQHGITREQAIAWLQGGEFPTPTPTPGATDKDIEELAKRLGITKEEAAMWLLLPEYAQTKEAEKQRAWEAQQLAEQQKAKQLATYQADPYKYWLPLWLSQQGLDPGLAGSLATTPTGTEMAPTPYEVARLTGGAIKPGEVFSPKLLEKQGLSTPSGQWWAGLNSDEKQRILGTLNWMGISPQAWFDMYQRMLPGVEQRQPVRWTR